MAVALHERLEDASDRSADTDVLAPRARAIRAHTAVQIVRVEQLPTVGHLVAVTLRVAR